MEGGTTAPDREFLAWCLRQPSIAYRKLATLCPDFLIISPPKTGSTWLAANLRCHPAIFVPEIKEVKYFSSCFKWLDLDWYLDHFAPGAGGVKGEASPSYAILPVERIGIIRRLMPDVKLIFLMRDPISRAWSHAKHNFRYREANFANCNEKFANISDSQWRENFAHEWPLASGDYLGHLRRWLSVFPREQFYVAFYESIGNSPQTLLREVFQFLEVSPDVELTGFPIAEKALPGLPGELPPGLRSVLRQLLGDRTRELASFLGERLGLRVPPEWQVDLDRADGVAESPTVGPHNTARNAHDVFQREFDDRYLSRVVEQEESFPSSPRPILDNYRDYHLVFYRGRFYALARGFPGRVDEIDESELRRYQDRGACFIAESLVEVKEAVDQHAFDRTQVELRVIESLRADLEEARRHISRLEETLCKAVSDVQCVEEGLRRVEAETAQRRPWHTVLAQCLREAWRRLRVFFRAK